MGNIQFAETAWEDYLYWQRTNSKMVKRINNLIEDISRNGYDGIGKPEPLKYGKSGYWSRRIDDEHRIVYRMDGDTAIIINCRGHYTD